MLRLCTISLSGSVWGGYGDPQVWWPRVQVCHEKELMMQNVWCCTRLRWSSLNALMRGGCEVVDVRWCELQFCLGGDQDRRSATGLSGLPQVRSLDL